MFSHVAVPENRSRGTLHRQGDTIPSALVGDDRPPSSLFSRGNGSRPLNETKIGGAQLTPPSLVFFGQSHRETMPHRPPASSWGARGSGPRTNHPLAPPTWPPPLNHAIRQAPSRCGRQPDLPFDQGERPNQILTAPAPANTRDVRLGVVTPPASPTPACGVAAIRRKSPRESVPAVGLIPLCREESPRLRQELTSGNWACGSLRPCSSGRAMTLPPSDTRFGRRLPAASGHDPSYRERRTPHLGSIG
ncbi:MAG: hypothetical protein UZ03_NOB001000307 [Nitrospira sp. OLB3]|nr:MAG: hypothetical protein UZ03_NOB001000307 [Nitrospira sp. OLB3]